MTKGIISHVAWDIPCPAYNHFLLFRAFCTSCKSSHGKSCMNCQTCISQHGRNSKVLHPLSSHHFQLHLGSLSEIGCHHSHCSHQCPDEFGTGTGLDYPGRGHLESPQICHVVSISRFLCIGQIHSFVIKAQCGQKTINGNS